MAQDLDLEMHVKGFTIKHPKVPEAYRGTYLGVASEAALKHLVDLGVSAVELLPIHHHLDERHLIERGLTNYWGYNTLAFFAPDLRYAARGTPLDSVQQFKMMVRALHSAGIEVILDVVYNHSARGKSIRPHAQYARHRQRELLPVISRKTTATTWIFPAAATR